ncbi:LysR substrate-binding domain-containing protein [Agarilytica rhodophyticola]|uniref:LysR substrate-binding domain-containing protein n=1 Tax=Agarilytica rhodophyticola TaxID=1737490 RepID=UPI000B347195|nr:LysR substrate-binding domain-containing protein [Agarilytica rhodophyticola]
MFSHLPQLNSLKVLESAARLNSFKAAAEELNITPTAISHQIAKLEEKLGVSLFIRQTRSIKLTSEGSKLAQSAHQALQQLSSTLEEISNVQSVLRIATTTSFASMWLVPHLQEFQTLYPEINIEIKTGEELVDIATDRRIDIAIRYGCFDDADDSCIKLATETFDAYATENYYDNCINLAHAKFIQAKWKNKNLPSITWQKWFEHNKLYDPCSAIIYFDQEDHVFQAALAGQGVALISSVLAQSALQYGWLKAYKNSRSLPGLDYYLLISPFSKGLSKVDFFQSWLVKKFSDCTFK